ncbi:MAG TPA: type II toxin-antitoxin system RelE/ParE family toxin [Thermoanaerobaculia bacterium]|nr:type II toxin-antitoxin system RelE/ParE family toxin [Thermoanaerobaculia bacterium]
MHDATRWYREISPELSRDFIQRIDDAIALVQERPFAFPVVYRRFHRILIHRFPYALFYYADDLRIIVVAILHQARDPETLRSR